MTPFQSDQPAAGSERAQEEQRAERDEPKSSGHEDLETRIRDLESALAASRAAAPINPIPTHGAGEGNDIAETWSLAEQEAMQNKP